MAIPMKRRVIIGIVLVTALFIVTSSSSALNSYSHVVLAKSKSSSKSEQDIPGNKSNSPGSDAGCTGNPHDVDQPTANPHDQSEGKSTGNTHECTATLKVVKHVENGNGGTAKASDFTITVIGANPSPGSFPGSEKGTDVTVDADVSYSVSETGPSGYKSSTDGDCSSSIKKDNTKTCTITNTFSGPPPQNNCGEPTFAPTQPNADIIVKKHVINDNIGTATASDFKLCVINDSSCTPSSSAANVQFNGEEQGTDIPWDSHFNYCVTENLPSGYSMDRSDDCFGGTTGINPGETKTCTITNDDLQ